MAAPIGRRWKEHTPLILALAAYWIASAVLVARSATGNGGRWVYPLDDTYIHMAMAKNMARYGIWGVTRHGFTSSSSSPLWTLLLAAGYAVCGVNEWLPLAMSGACGSAAVWVVYRILRESTTSPAYTLAALLLVVFITPLPTLTACGMEHLLHAALTVGFACLAGRGGERRLWGLAALLTATRFEGLFLVSVVGAALALRRQIWQAVGVWVAGGLPVLIYGLISLAHGWFFLPNSIILKGYLTSYASANPLASLAQALARNFSYGPATLALVAYLALLSLLTWVFRLRRQRGHGRSGSVMTWLFIVVTYLHVQFAGLGWFYRYEAYLILFGLLIVTREIYRLFADRMPDGVLVSLLLALALPFASRAAHALIETPQASKNIHEQQYQMGLFLREFYTGESVAANDIGAITYLADVDVLDLWGLSGLETTRSIMHGAYDSRQVANLARQRGVKVALVYDHLLERLGGTPSGWVKVGEWAIVNNVICGGDVISFYATHPAEEKRLVESLRAFSPTLPPDVVERID